MLEKKEELAAEAAQHHEEAPPPPYDPWLAIPDNALLPPPPPMKEVFSPANNASSADAERAEAWCKANHLWGPRTWHPSALSQIDGHQFSLSPPPGSSIKIVNSGPGRTSLTTNRRQGDNTILSSLPLYAAQYHGLKPGEQRTIYYQVRIIKMSGSDATVAIGLVAPPFPPSRLPGWHRGSLAVHNDDGHRFVNDDEGGIDFVPPFGEADTVGIGMNMTGSQYQGQPAQVRVFFTRGGREENSWDLHESRDAKALEGGVYGLEGTTDLYAAIGVCGGVELEVNWAV